MWYSVHWYYIFFFFFWCLVIRSRISFILGMRMEKKIIIRKLFMFINSKGIEILILLYSFSLFVSQIFFISISSTPSNAIHLNEQTQMYHFHNRIFHWIFRFHCRNGNIILYTKRIQNVKSNNRTAYSCNAFHFMSHLSNEKHRLNRGKRR